MIQIGLIIMGVFAIMNGARALAGTKQEDKHTEKPVAIAMLVIGIGLIIFALIGLPALMASM